MYTGKILKYLEVYRGIHKSNSDHYLHNSMRNNFNKFFLLINEILRFTLK